jgi:hypothetical protein
VGPKKVWRLVAKGKISVQVHNRTPGVQLAAICWDNKSVVSELFATQAIHRKDIQFSIPLLCYILTKTKIFTNESYRRRLQNLCTMSRFNSILVSFEVRIILE